LAEVCSSGALGDEIQGAVLFAAVIALTGLTAPALGRRTRTGTASTMRSDCRPSDPEHLVRVLGGAGTVLDGRGRRRASAGALRFQRPRPLTARVLRRAAHQRSRPRGLRRLPARRTRSSTSVPEPRLDDSTQRVLSYLVRSKTSWRRRARSELQRRADAKSAPAARWPTVRPASASAADLQQRRVLRILHHHQQRPQQLRRFVDTSARATMRSRPARPGTAR
jgi:hypothetical protein